MHLNVAKNSIFLNIRQPPNYFFRRMTACVHQRWNCVSEMSVRIPSFFQDDHRISNQLERCVSVVIFLNEDGQSGEDGGYFCNVQYDV